jgi:hypothetical protein
MLSKVLRTLAALGAVALVLGACGSTSVVVTATPTPTVAVPTATPTVTAVPTVSATVITACFGQDAAGLHVTQIGDLLFTPVQLGGLAYPSAMLPDGTPLDKPFKMTSQNLSNYTADFPTSPITNPSLMGMGDGFNLQICNVSSGARHVLQSVSERIETFTTYSGALNSWNRCDGSVDSHHQLGPAGCGGAIAYCVCFSASFPAGSVAGATVTATQTDSSLNSPGDGLAKFPMTLDPGKAVGFYVSTGSSWTPGRYVFNIGVAVDGGVAIYAPTPAGEVLLAPVAHKWNASTCLNTPALLSQITPTTPETYYICSK